MRIKTNQKQEMFVGHILKIGLIFRIYKELSKIPKKKSVYKFEQTPFKIRNIDGK